MKRMMSFALVSILGLVVAELNQAATITVGLGTDHDFDTIQAGIDTAVDGDMVLVASGEYVIIEPITFQGKAITLKSEDGPDETTIRMGTPSDTNRGTVVIFENNETAASLLEGFTITGGRGIFAPPVNGWVGGGIYFNASSGTVKNCVIIQNSANYGGGVICTANSLVTVNNCTIAGNSATGSGGGMFSVFNSSVTMTDCIVRGNSVTGAIMGVAGYGGGVNCAESSLVNLTNCEIADNSAGMGGGGIYFVKTNAASIITNCIIIGNSAGNWGAGLGCELTEIPLAMRNCVIAHNTAGEGIGGVACALGADATISNCTIWGNSGGSMWGASGLGCWKGSATVNNSIIWANISPKGYDISVEDSISTLTIVYSDVAGGRDSIYIDGGTLNWGEGNIDDDPHFADPNNDDFHLKSQAGQWDPNSQTWVHDDVTSPCIDAGDPNSDCTAELWPHGERINMGAYGNTSKASRSLSDAGNIADLNRDGIIDSADMSIMVDYWLTDEPAYDIAPPPFGDGIVDVQDLIMLAEHLFESAQIPQVTTVVIVRHAERSNGTLTEVGEKRAETLARLLSKVGVSAIFSTNYTRTIETANNTAERLGIPIQFYTSIEGVADLIKSEYTGKIVLVVGHSNTVTQTVEAVGVSSVPQFDGKYDNLYIVTIGPDGIALLTHLRFDIHPDL